MKISDIKEGQHFVLEPDRHDATVFVKTAGYDCYGRLVGSLSAIQENSEAQPKVLPGTNVGFVRDQEVYLLEPGRTFVIWY